MVETLAEGGKGETGRDRKREKEREGGEGEKNKKTLRSQPTCSELCHVNP